MSYLLVFLGAGIGGALRHAVNVLAARTVGIEFPVGTFAINVVGSFAMGVLMGVLAARAGGQDGLRLFLGTGVLGGFTTFSAFSLEAVTLVERGRPGLAIAYVAGSVALAILGLVLGLMLARRLA